MECVQAWVASNGRRQIRSMVSSKTIASRAEALLHTAMVVITKDSLKKIRDMVLAKVNGRMVHIT